MSVFVILCTVPIVIYFAEKMKLDVHLMFDYLYEGFNFTSSSFENNHRSDQFYAMTNEWKQSPLFGAGHGASAKSSIRSEEIPWAYELSYVSLLFHTGILGFLCYLAGIIWIFLKGLEIIKSDHWLSTYMSPVLVGTLCFLIANATNPYLEKFDYMWVIFLPVAMINIWLLDRNQWCKSPINK
jgi:O-antigen ligase